MAAIDQRLYPSCAVPAPLRLPPKRLVSGPDSRGVSPVPPPKRSNPGCSLLSKLPGQPVFSPAGGFGPEMAQQTSKRCNCSTSASSPSQSPLPSPRFSTYSSVSSYSSSSSGRSSFNSFNSRGAPSLDFSSLFMKSNTLRHDLENCTCNRAESPEMPEIDHSTRYSVASGFTSVYSD